MSILDLINCLIMVETVHGSFDTKCGEIFFEADGRFVLACYACSEQFYKYDNFEGHIITYHLPNSMKLEVDDVKVAQFHSIDEIYSKACSKLADADEVNANEFKHKSIDKELDSTKSKNSSIEERNMTVEVSYEPLSYISSNIKYQSGPVSPSDISEYQVETITIHNQHEEKVGYISPVSGKITKIKSETLNFEENAFKCVLCQKHFPSNRSLKTHMHIHSEERPFKCTMCPQAFKNRANLHTHKRSHVGDKRFSCDFCAKKFIRNSERLVHMRTHTGEKPYQCDECGLRFTTSGLLHEHRKRHSNTRNYQCEVCLKRFYNKELLKNHKISHSTEKPFECLICFKTFSRKKNLTAHKKIHSEIKEYICELCGKAFAQGPGLICHMKKHKR